MLWKHKTTKPVASHIPELHKTIDKVKGWALSHLMIWSFPPGNPLTWLHLYPLHLAHAIRPIPPWIALAESYCAGPMTAALVDAVHAVTEIAVVAMVAINVASRAA